jgi:orotidine-5'-phosphate decarboxylase
LIFHGNTDNHMKVIPGEVNVDGGLMVALDMDDENEAVVLAREIGPQVAALKVGSQLFTRCGPKIVREISDCGGSVFLDLKFHDIPNTVAKAVGGASDLGVAWLTVHASGGQEMIKAAKNAAGDTRILAVTVLTSLDEEGIRRIGWQAGIDEQVGRLAVLARDAGADGIVCSAREVASLRGLLDEDCILVTPGIRPAGTSLDDQARTATPEGAVASGADYLVVGRPIVKASDRKQAVSLILQEMEKGRHGRAAFRVGG